MADENDGLKIGATISKDTKGKLSKLKEMSQAIAAMIDEMTPIDPEDTIKLLEISDTVVTYGGAVKATTLENGDVKLGGYLVTFADENNPDLEGDFFTKNTDFGDAEKSDGWFHHCMPLKYGGKSLKYTGQLPDVTLTKDDTGVFAEIVLGSRNKYEKLLADLGMAGILGWSSGTAPNLITEKAHKNGSNEITRWKLGLDASLTPTPAEPMNRVIPLKSISDNFAELVDESETAQTVTISEPAPTKSIKELDMTPEEIQAMIDGAVEKATKATESKVLEAMKSAPAPDSTGTPVITVTHDEGDTPFANLAEQVKAARACQFAKGRDVQIHPRIKALAVKASGAYEGEPASGGYLLEPTITSEILKPMHEKGVFSSKVRRLPVGSNSNSGYINGVNETSRADGSRWGGVQSYWLAEAATIIASRPKFRRINWELKKIAVLMYATDELLADSAQFSAVAKQAASEEIDFKVNDAILNGLGVGGPLGILTSAAVAIEARDTASMVLHVDMLNAWARLLPRNRANAEWYVTTGVETQLQQLYFTGTTSVMSPYVTYGQDGIMRVMGKKVNVTEFNQALNTKGDLLLADMSEYLFWEKAGVDSAVSMHIAFDTDETAFRFIYRCDGQPSIAAPLTPYKGSATQGPFVSFGSATATS
ncbi:MAG: phage major capsid protein [Candidatus Omnitrophota bacterium]